MCIHLNTYLIIELSLYNSLHTQVARVNALPTENTSSRYHRSN